MFKWITNLFKPTPDKVEERLLTVFDFLLRNYGFRYSKEELGNAVDKDGKLIFYGPFNAYQLYNDNICISILHLVQRDEYDVYVSNEKTADQVLIIKGTQLPSDLAYNFSLLAMEIKLAISNNREFYGYKL